MHRFFFMLLLVFLPTQLGYHFWPDWSMVLGRKVDYLSPTLYFTDILLFLTVSTWLVGSIIRSKNQISHIHIKNRKYLLFVVLVLLATANILFAQNKMVAIYTWLKVGEFILLGWYIIRTKPSLTLVTYILSFSVVYSSIIAIGQFLLQRSIGGPLWWLGERTFTIDTPGIARISWYGQDLLRSYATFPHPNVLGGFLAVTLPLVFNALIRPIETKPTNKFQQKNDAAMKQYLDTARFQRRIYGTAFILGAVALIVSFSRSAWVVGSIGIGVAYIGSQKKKVFTGAPLLFLSLMLIVIFFISRTFSSYDESVVVRSQLNVAAFTLWRQSPLIGVGLGNFLVKLPEALPSRTIYFLQPVHNIYLLILTETGIAGFVFFLWLLWRALQRQVPSNTSSAYGGLSGRKKQEKQNPDQVACLVSLVSLFLLGLVDHYPITLQQGQLFLTILLALSHMTR